jgi:glutathione S-transferase
MKIVSFKICPFVQRVIGVLELKGVEYEVEYISLADKPNWFLQASPHGQVPILMTKYGVLFESEPISEYIDEIYDEISLHPQNPFLRAQNRAWISLASRNYLVQCRTQRSPTEEKLGENLQGLREEFRKIEGAKVDGPYFNGKAISQVDVAWFVILYRTHLVSQCTNVDFLSEFPILQDWRDTLLKTESLRKSAPSGFREEFANFYLNEGTYLGSLMSSQQGNCGNAMAACCDAETLTTCCR